MQMIRDALFKLYCCQVQLHMIFVQHNGKDRYWMIYICKCIWLHYMLAHSGFKQHHVSHSKSSNIKRPSYGSSHSEPVQPPETCDCRCWPTDANKKWFGYLQISSFLGLKSLILVKKWKPPKIIKKNPVFLRKIYVIFAQVERNWT